MVETGCESVDKVSIFILCISREGFFTHNNTKSPHDFKMALNNSFGHGGRLNLSMTQKDLFRFIESVESLSRASDKQLVTSAGLQNDKHTMAINNKLFIDREGNEVYALNRLL